MKRALFAMRMMNAERPGSEFSSFAAEVMLQFGSFNV